MALVTLRASRSPADAARAFAVVRDLSASYPGFARWYAEKVLPDLASGAGTMTLAEQDGEVVGLALGKRTPSETKLRCIRVVPRLRGRGLGPRLIDGALAQLGCDRPLCTVPEEMLHEYATTFVNRYGFSLTEVARGMYRESRLEYVFNGPAC